MQIKYLRIVGVFLLIAMMASFTNSPALPQGKGVQMYNPGLGTDSDQLIKGVFYHSVFQVADLTIKVGTWVTITFGFLEYSFGLDQVDATLDFIREEISTYSWFSSFNGVDITAGLLAGGHYEAPIILDVGGGWYSVNVRFVYYINPQAKGCYDYYGMVSNDQFGFFVEKFGSICWMSGSYF